MTGSNTNSTHSPPADPFADLASDYAFKWVVVCGDQMGRVFQFDVTELTQQIRCLDKDAKPRISTSILAAYQQHAVSSFRDGLDEKRLRYVEALLQRPVGAKSGSSHQKMTEILGYRGANIGNIKRMRFWFAYQGGSVSAIAALQKTTQSYPYAASKGGGSGPLGDGRGQALMLEPYAIVTANEVACACACVCACACACVSACLSPSSHLTDLFWFVCVCLCVCVPVCVYASVPVPVPVCVTLSLSLCVCVSLCV
jgi:hypothetical protein